MKTKSTKPKINHSNMKLRLFISTILLLFLITTTIKTNLTDHLKTNMIIAYSVFYLVHVLMTITNINNKENDRKYKF